MKMERCPVIPSVKQFTPGPGNLDAGSIEAVRVSGDLMSLAAHVQRACERLRIEVPIEEGNGSKEIVFGSAPGPALSPNGDGEEEYAIGIGPSSIRISTNGAKGAFLAIKTVEQLSELGDGILPCAGIVDWPDLAVRGYHLDCKGGLPPLDGLYRFVDRLAAWKINTLLIEYEDRFPYKFAPELALPGSPSRDEWAAFLDHCRSMGMNPVPLIQTLGHLEFVLKHDRFAHLAEDGNINELCPSNPEAVDVALTMVDEVCELHGPDPWFHIGADEAWNLGSCAACRKRLERVQKLELFCEHTLKIHKLLAAKNKRAMMWCDMFWRHENPESIERLPKDIIMCDWLYSSPTWKGQPFLFWNNKQYYTRKYCELHPEVRPRQAEYVEDLGKKARDFVARYFRPDPETGVGVSAPFSCYFGELGFQMLGVSAARCGQPNTRFGQNNMMDRFVNIANWANFAFSQEIMGVISSSWSRSSGPKPLYAPWDTAWDAIAAGAQYYWNTDTPFETFVKLAADSFYGADLSVQLGNVYHYLGKNDHFALKNINAIEQQTTRNTDYVRLLKLWCEFDLYRDGEEAGLSTCEHQLAGLTYGKMAPGTRGKFVDWLNDIINRLNDWRKKLREGVSPYFRPEDAKEYADSRVCALEFRAGNMKRRLEEG